MGDFWLWYAGTLGKIFSHPGKPPDIGRDAAMLERVNAIAGLELLIWIVAAPLAAAALAHAASELAEGRSASFRESLRFGVRHWPGMWLLLIVGGVMLGAVFFAGYLGLVLLALLAALILHSVAVGVVLGVVVLTAWIALLLIASVAVGVGFVTFIAEPVNALRAFAVGIERVINRASLWRSLLIGLLYAAVAAGFSMVAYGAGFGLLFTLHTGIPMIVIAAIASVVQFGFSLLIIVLYYYDLRARREGTDLAALATQVAASH
ncbi:MAG: hypothetical protein JOZ97_04255 [Candidatus Eremiobacteraeota bacterium]|nr:hypothetical protein [Candidatus Eremiobacteraeota bacterium]